MAIKQTLNKIERDIASGDYGKARDRLHGLIATYPDNLALRRKLGKVYWQLQYPAMAGRYWYLEEDKSPDMVAACKAFERSCGNSSLQMLLFLKFRGDLESIDSVFARQTLRTLQSQVKEKYGYYITFGKRGAEKYQWTPARKPRDVVVGVACVVAVLVGLGLMLVGLVTVINWLFWV
jgi:hypothetical protein